MFELLETDFPDDTPTTIYVKRCREILDNPDAIPEDWDGTTKLDKKKRCCKSLLSFGKVC